MRLLRKRDDAPFYLVSSAGVPNYGDELITRAWLDWLAKHHPGVPVWLDCIEPGRANHLFADAHPLLRTTNTLWHLAFSGAGMPLEEGEEHVTRLIRDLGSPRFDAGLRDLRGVRSLHLLGGGYLNSVWPHQLLLLPALKALGEAQGIPLYATGQGMSPLDDDARRFVPEWVGAFEYFETRDEPSATLARAHQGIDDAFLSFANRRHVYARHAAPSAMVLVQGDFGGDEEADALADEVTAFARRYGRGRPVGVVESLPPDDGWILPRLADRGVATDFYPFLRVWDDGFPARRGQVWLSTRFHSHLMAAAAGAGGTVLNLKSDYYGVKHSSLLDLGTGWSLAGGVADVGAAAPAASRDFGTRSNRRDLGREKSRIATLIYG